jgi:hypothetical protein
MGSWRKFAAGLLVIAGLGMFAPSAMAQLPEDPIPPGTVPPEVQAAIDEATATALENLPAVPSIPGTKEASVTPGSSEASVVNIPGVVTLGQSKADKTSSKVTVLSIGGEEVLVRNGDATGGTWGGHAAPAGDAIDAFNDAACPGGPPAATDAPRGCVLLLYSPATTKSTTTETAFTKTTNNTNTASFRALSIYSPAGPESITLGHTTAFSNHTQVNRKLDNAVLFSRCSDVATSFLVMGGGQLAALILVNPDPAGGIKFSVLQPC